MVPKTILGVVKVFSPNSFSAKSFLDKSFTALKQLVEETIQIVFGGSGWNFDPDELNPRITGKNDKDELIVIEDEEIIEFLLTFSLWRSIQR